MSRDHKQKSHITVEGTERIKSFSDGVMAVVVTLLIFELHVPVVHELSSRGVWMALGPIAPKLIAFAVSFITVAIFWVNHHHFFHPIKKTSGALLWYNNSLLFWICTIPFVTAFIGDYPRVPLVVALYGFVLFMAVLSFTIMTRYVFFHSNLLPDSIPDDSRIKEFRRAYRGVIMYAFSIAVAFVHPYLALPVFILVPLYYFIPSRVNA